MAIWINSAEAQTERLKEAEEALADAKKPDLVPGVVYCARCNFRLNRVTLYMGNGAIGPGGSETEQCPNGCGPMWPVTWKQEAEDAYKTAESQFERAKAAEDQIDACRPYLKEGETVADALKRLSERKTVRSLCEAYEACKPFLKDGEAPAECLARNRADIARLMGKWGTEKMVTAKLRTALNEIICLNPDSIADAYVIAGEALGTSSGPLDCLHINQGSMDAAADAYAVEYAAAHPEGVNNK